MVNLLGQERIWLTYIAKKGMVAYIAHKKRVWLIYLARKGYG